MGRRRGLESGQYRYPCLLCRRPRRLPHRPPRRRAGRLHLGREVRPGVRLPGLLHRPARRCAARATASRSGVPAWRVWRAAMSGSTASWRSRPTIASRASARPGTTSVTRERRPPLQSPAGVSLLDARSVRVRQARRLRPPLLSRGARFLPGVVDHAARTCRDGGGARRRAGGFCGDAGVPGGVARRVRCSPPRRRSLRHWSPASPPRPALRPWRSTCPTSTSRPSRLPNGSG